MITGTIPDGGAAVATTRDARGHPAAVPRWTAALLGLAAIGGFLVIALARLGYPFALELLESNSLVEVHRILAGQPLYAAPTAGYVPDGYPPLYFGVSAAAASVLGQSYLPLRLVSLLSSVACFAITGRLVQRETGSAPAGMAAAGLLAATYFACGTWFDVGRVDSLFLALSAGGLYAARWMRRPRGAVAAGLLLAAAFLTKQTGLAEGVAVLAALAAGPRRRLAIPAALAYAGVLGASTLALGLASHGWYVYYVFEQMSQHALNFAAAGQFWTRYLLPALGIAIGAALLGARRLPPVLLAGCAALVAEALAALVHTGGGVNDLLPAYLVVALLAGMGMGDGPAPAGWPARGLAPGRAVCHDRGLRPGHCPDGDAGDGLPGGPGDPFCRRPHRRPAPDGRPAGAARDGRDPGRPGAGAHGGAARGRGPAGGGGRAARGGSGRPGGPYGQSRDRGGRPAVHGDHHRDQR